MRTDIPKEVLALAKEKGIIIKPGSNTASIYKLIGVVHDPNADAKLEVGFHDDLTKFKKINREKQLAEADLPQKPEIESHIFEEAMAKLPDGKKYQKHLTEWEIKVVAQLRANYGRDFDAMAIDNRLNPMQWTAKQLKKINETYELQAEKLKKDAELQKSLEEEEEEEEKENQ